MAPAGASNGCMALRADHPRGDRLGELADVRIVGADGLVVVPPRDGDAVLRLGQLVLQADEVLIRPQRRVGFDRDVEEGAQVLADGGARLAELIGIGSPAAWPRRPAAAPPSAPRARWATSVNVWRSNRAAWSTVATRFGIRSLRRISSVSMFARVSVDALVQLLDPIITAARGQEQDRHPCPAYDH